MGLPKTETASTTNDIIKCFDKINENVGVNRAPVRIRHSGRAEDSDRDTFEKENLITRKIKRIKRASPGFRFVLAIRVGPGSGVGTKEVCRKVGRFMYSEGLPFNTVNDPYWIPMMDAVTNFGPGFKPPSMHELSTWILIEEVNDLSIIMEDHKRSWKQYGCSIMSDGWTDGKIRFLINFMVNSPTGTGL